MICRSQDRFIVRHRWSITLQVCIQHMWLELECLQSLSCSPHIEFQTLESESAFVGRLAEDRVYTHIESKGIQVA